jgi:hypothetical protein
MKKFFRGFIPFVFWTIVLALIVYMIRAPVAPLTTDYLDKEAQKILDAIKRSENPAPADK